MVTNSLKNMRYSNMILKIIVGMSPGYSTVSFRTIPPGLAVIGCPTYTDISLSNKDGSLKRFRSLKTLYSFLNKVYQWPIHPDLAGKDLLLSTVDLLVL